MALDPSTPRSRRAILAAAAGAAAATLVGAVTRPSIVRAAGDDASIIHIGDFYADARSQTTWSNQSNDNIVLWVASNPDSGGGGGHALVGYSDHGVGVAGAAGASPISGTSVGVFGVGGGTAAGVKGQANGTGLGVLGYSAGGYGVQGTSVATQGIGVYGTCNTGNGVFGSAASGNGVYGFATGSGIGVRADSTQGAPAVAGRSLGNSTAVLGYSGSDPLPSAKVKTGIYGYATQDSLSKGVWGSSPAGHGIHGESASGWAGYFDGKVFTNKFHEMKEISVPSAPTANKARLFIRDNGSGKTQLCVRFHSGAVQVIATQP